LLDHIDAMATSFVPEVTPLALHKAAQVTQVKAASGPRQGDEDEDISCFFWGKMACSLW
jgi:hypothetical protein